MDFKSKIIEKKITIGIVGLGYVGLPLAVEFCRAGIKVIGIDTSEQKVKSINDGVSYIGDISSNELSSIIDSGLFSATNDYAAVSKCDSVSICVPTPLRKTKEPDMSYIQSAMENITPHMHRDMIIVLESTTYPGTTEELILPELNKTGLKVGEDYYLCFSPERIDPANEKYKTRNTPKVIGGVTPLCTELAIEVYRHAVDTIVPVSSPRAAEFVKLLENTFRAINIGLANELALICDRLNIDVWEIIEAAATKPFGFMPFYPGPGLGGHCIPIDPLYLTWKLRAYNFNTRFITLADEVNSNMPRYVVNKSGAILNELNKSIKGSKILVLGVAYKKNIKDFRESPAIDIIGLLADRGAILSINDDLAGNVEVAEVRYESREITPEFLDEQDLIIIATNHDYYDYSLIANSSAQILDTRNVMKDYRKSRNNIHTI